jgi:hypothetical protein
MKQFWTDLCLELDSEEWKCPTDKKHIIDLSWHCLLVAIFLADRQQERATCCTQTA